jgi:hypothetical protein
MVMWWARVQEFYYKPEGLHLSPDEIIDYFFNLPNPSNRTMSLGLA